MSRWGARRQGDADGPVRRLQKRDRPGHPPPSTPVSLSSELLRPMFHWCYHSSLCMSVDVNTIFVPPGMAVNSIASIRRSTCEADRARGSCVLLKSNRQAIEGTSPSRALGFHLRGGVFERLAVVGSEVLALHWAPTHESPALSPPP